MIHDSAADPGYTPLSTLCPSTWRCVTATCVGSFGGSSCQCGSRLGCGAGRGCGEGGGGGSGGRARACSPVRAQSQWRVVFRLGLLVCQWGQLYNLVQSRCQCQWKVQGGIPEGTLAWGCESRQSPPRSGCERSLRVTGNNNYSITTKSLRDCDSDAIQVQVGTVLVPARRGHRDSESLAGCQWQASR